MVMSTNANIIHSSWTDEFEEDRRQRNRERISPLKFKLVPYDSRLDCYNEWSPGYLNSLAWPKKYEKFDFSMISASAEFINWREARQSELLLLHGHSHLNSGYHWLSAASFHLLDMLKQESGKTGHAPLFAFLHPDPWLSDFAHVPQQEVISLLIWQLLEQFPEISENTSLFEMNEARMQREEWLEDDCSEQYHVLAQRLSQRSETYIILDRLDSCDCPVDTFVQKLLGIVGSCATVVKIFVVVGGSFDVKSVVSSQKSRLTVLSRDQQRRKKV